MAGPSEIVPPGNVSVTAPEHAEVRPELAGPDGATVVGVSVGEEVYAVVTPAATVVTPAATVVTPAATVVAPAGVVLPAARAAPKTCTGRGANRAGGHTAPNTRMFASGYNAPSQTLAS